MCLAEGEPLCSSSISRRLDRIDNIAQNRDGLTTRNQEEVQQPDGRYGKAGLRWTQVPCPPRNARLFDFSFGTNKRKRGARG